MAECKYLITCAGWEDRFLEGLNRNIELHEVEKVVVFVVSEFLEKTAEKLEKLRTFLGSEMLEEINISLLKDVETWQMLDVFFDQNGLSDKRLCVDITTMPRFLIWFLMHYLDKHNNTVEYIYFRPERYEKCDWLTSDAETPRLVFKHSGIYLPDRPTVLVIQTGFDIERVNQLIYTYEPEKVLLAAQTGDQFNNSLENIAKHKEHLKYQDIEYFEMDAFKGDYGYQSIEKVVLTFKETHNIVLSSFGPKPGSLAMFYLNKNHPEIGLSYVLVKNYNSHYSHGADLDSAITINSDSFV